MNGSLMLRGKDTVRGAWRARPLPVPRPACVSGTHSGAPVTAEQGAGPQRPDTLSTCPEESAGASASPGEHSRARGQPPGRTAALVSSVRARSLSGLSAHRGRRGWESESDTLATFRETSGSGTRFRRMTGLQEKACVRMASGGVSLEGHPVGESGRELKRPQHGPWSTCPEPGPAAWRQRCHSCSQRSD